MMLWIEIHYLWKEAQISTTTLLQKIYYLIKQKGTLIR
ncbi:unnamed protein product [Paramecium octaurelia]|uniref:Uncharacterized protein n=1 Tax=Paramecium octaurelia TaxID=43137 RepID=A0A8S1SWP2_PAROT|nr:unnamed protein product [Paramecium octaurelia]